MQVTATIESVEVSRTGTSGKGPWTLWHVKAGGERYSTFSSTLSIAATKLIGQSADIGYTEKQQGKYVNRDLDSVLSTEAPASPTSPAPTGAGTWVDLTIEKCEHSEYWNVRAFEWGAFYTTDPKVAEVLANAGTGEVVCAQYRDTASGKRQIVATRKT